MSFGHEVLILFAVTNGYLDDVAVHDVRGWENRLHTFVDAAHPEVLRLIERDGEIKQETETLLRAVLAEYKSVPE